jgi:hypothetical protein
MPSGTELSLRENQLLEDSILASYRRVVRLPDSDLVCRNAREVELATEQCGDGGHQKIVRVVFRQESMYAAMVPA